MRIEFDNVGYTYAQNTPFAWEAVHGLDLVINGSERIGMIGPTGSGKSTVVRLIAGLAGPSTGCVRINGKAVTRARGPKKGQIGVVFQQPEDQLFAETVVDEVAYGARNMGLRGKALSERVEWALWVVGLEIKQVGHRSPFHLGGGEKRLLSIASVLAMRPSFLILDEPTINLDARGKQRVLESIASLHSEHRTGILVASHHLEELLPLTSRLIVLHEGEIVYDGVPDGVLLEAERLEQIGLEAPPLPRLMLALQSRGLSVQTNVYSVEDAIRTIQSALA